MDWTSSEKKIARKAFDAAVERELASLLAKFKQDAAAVSNIDEVWEIGERLQKARRAFDAKYDFRYSQLIFVFHRLLREGWVSESDLAGLHEDKLKIIRAVVKY